MVENTNFTNILKKEIFELSLKEHKFVERNKNGKTRETTLNLDQYIYKIINSVDIVTYKDFETLKRTTEDSGEINLTRRAFYRVNDNMFKTLMP